MPPRADEIVVNLLSGSAPGIAAASLMVAEIVEFPQPAKQDWTRIVRQRLRCGRDYGVLTRIAAGDNAIGVRRRVIARPGDHRNTPVADVALQSRIRLEYAVHEFLRKIGPLEIVKMKRNRMIDAQRWGTFTNLDGRFGIGCERWIRPDPQVGAICRNSREVRQPRPAGPTSMPAMAGAYYVRGPSLDIHRGHVRYLAIRHQVDAHLAHTGKAGRNRHVHLVETLILTLGAGIFHDAGWPATYA